MSVYRSAKSPHWQFDFQLKGRRFFGSTGTPDRALARQVERAERERAVRGLKLGEKPEITIDDAFGRFHEEVSDFEASERTQFGQFATMLALLGKGLHLSELDDGRIAKMVARLRNGRGDATCNKYVALLRRVWRRAKKVWKSSVGEEPDWALHRFEEPSERVRELSAGEEAELFNHLRPDYHDLMRFALASGARLRSLIRLTWKQVDWEARRLKLRVKSKRRGGREALVPISTSMLIILRRCHGQHPIFVFTYVCAKTRQKRRRGERYPFSQDGWRKPWGAALKAAKIEDYRFHDHRHTAASRTLRGSKNLKAVQKMLAHADLKSTLRYAHVHDDEVLAAMDRAESRNSPGAPSNEAPKKAVRSGA